MKSMAIDTNAACDNGFVNIIMTTLLCIFPNDHGD